MHCPGRARDTTAGRNASRIGQHVVDPVVQLSIVLVNFGVTCGETTSAELLAFVC